MFDGIEKSPAVSHPAYGNFTYGMKVFPTETHSKAVQRHLALERDYRYSKEYGFSCSKSSVVVEDIRDELAKLSCSILSWTLSDNYPDVEVLFEFDSGLGHARAGNKDLFLTVCATTEASAALIGDSLRKALIDETVTPGKTKVNFWNSTSTGSTYRERELDMPGWDEIKENYPESIQEELKRTITAQPMEESGLILWTGEPGTGKTTSLRAMIKSWSKFAHIDVITDPEQMLNDVGYLNNVILTTQQDMFGNSDDVFKPKLVILEDAGELITHDAKSRSGQALSRLLNVTDGLLGQGTNTYILITTNEPFSSLHEAASRNGRCISHVDFESLSLEESVAWLEAKGVENPTLESGQTLANLYGTLKGIVGKPSRSSKKVFGFSS